ncbi:transcription factor ORG2 isoform X2 [Manihot esculenta]|uniref:Uncharacterized protein n=1 Tax=Manihot esculenta TaxID=3983 RepID=A0ACB7H8D5_MANES|nr:transcription factor ORG2 isoform X2 [Manihot esculenta]KAG8648992.1 hypothetical protein MANES_08G058700v8 [Manihot esculenta]
MLALSPPVFPAYGWPLEDPIGHEHIYFSRESEKTINSIDNANFFQPQPPQTLELDHSASFTYHSGDPNMVKKLNHNASERHRRKKMNSLYSSLRSLLPAADQMKLSIAATVSGVLKYIPELQGQVERLVQRKEELFSKLAKQDNQSGKKQIQQKKGINRGSLSAVSATHVSESEVVIQISSFGVRTTPLSELLVHLEKEGLSLISSSSFESSGGRVFLNLHLQVEGSYRLEQEALSEKLLSLI